MLLYDKGWWCTLLKNGSSRNIRIWSFAFYGEKDSEIKEFYFVLHPHGNKTITVLLESFAATNLFCLFALYDGSVLSGLKFADLPIILITIMK